MITQRDKLEIAFLAKQPKSNKSQIARDYNIPRNNVMVFMKMFDDNYNKNAELRHQILLGSKLGDGYFQVIKTANKETYKYRESHSLSEKEYLMWKYLLLGRWSEGTSMIDKNRNTAVEIYTSNKASNFVKYYYNLSTRDVIDMIKIEGLLVWLLDDGWYSNHSKNGNYVICSTILSVDEKIALQAKLKSYGIDSCLIGQRKDISISSQDNFVLLAHLNKMLFTLNLDIVNKKFGTVIKQLTTMA